MDQPAPIFDAKQLERLSGLRDGADPNVLANLARGYLARAPQRLLRMRELLAAGKVSQLADEAHALASSCGMFGMMRMRMGCKALENLVRAEGIVAAAGELLAGLELSFEEARPQLVAALELQD
jgi:HPt (histidine-containing phosphotransfer) domain-containing protein